MSVRALRPSGTRGRLCDGDAACLTEPLSSFNPALAPAELPPPTLIYGKPSIGKQPQIVFGDAPLEDIIYDDMRGKLIHEGEIESTVTLDECRLVDGNLTGTFRVGGSGKPHEFPDFWALHLLKAVKEAPENWDLFEGNKMYTNKKCTPEAREEGFV